MKNIKYINKNEKLEKDLFTYEYIINKKFRR